VATREDQRRPVHRLSKKITRLNAASRRRNRARYGSSQATILGVGLLSTSRRAPWHGVPRGISPEISVARWGS